MLDNLQIVKAHIRAITKAVADYGEPISLEVCSLLDRSVAVGDVESAISALKELRQWLERNMSNIESNQFEGNADSYAQLQSEILDIIDFLEHKGTLLTDDKKESPKKKMVFISHSSKDYECVTTLVDLLRKAGLDRDSLFCSSYPGYGVPTGEPIFDFLKRCFTDYELLVILMVSKDYYYSSPASLNEMGAAWVLGSTCIPILLPGMNPGDMQGVIGSSRLALILNSEDAKYRLTELKDTVCRFLGIPENADDAWDFDRGQFLIRAHEITPAPADVSKQGKGLNESMVDRLVNGEVLLSDALLKLKVVSHRAGNTKTEQWAERELQGYDRNDDLPDYRKTENFDLHYTGINGMFQVKDAPLPLGFLSEKENDSIKDITAYQGISTIEQAVASDKYLAIDRTIFAGEVSKSSGGSIQCTSIMQKVPMSFFESIIATVKNRLIDILLQEEETPSC